MNQMNLMPHPSIVAALKAAMPGANDQMLVGAWRKAVEGNPVVAQQNPQLIAQGIMTAMAAANNPKEVPGMEDAQGMADGGEVEDTAGDAGTPPPVPTTVPPQSPQVTSTIPVPNVPVKLADPYAGSTTTQANLMNAFDPAMMKAAAARELALRQQQLPARITSQTYSAMGVPGSVAANENAWKAIDAANALQGTGLQDLLQKQSTAGIEAAGKIVDQMDKSGRFQIDASNAALAQKKLQLELIGTAASSGLTQKLMDASTPESAAARNSAIALLMQTKLYTPAQVGAMVPKTMNGISAANIGALAGGNLKDLLTVGQTAQAHGAAAASYGAAEQARATALKERVEAAGMVAGQTYNTAAGIAAPANYGGVGAPQVTATPLSPEAAEAAAGSVGERTPTTGPTGQTSWAASTQAQQAGRETATALTDLGQSINGYKQSGVQQKVQDVVVKAPTLGGVTGAGGRNIINIGNTQATKDYELSIDRLNQEAAHLGLIAPKEGGGALGAAMGATGAQLAKSGMPGVGTALSAGAGYFNGGQPVTSKTNPKVVQELALQVQEVRQRQEALLPYANAYQKKHGGSLVGFIVPNEIASRPSMVNPSTGELKVAANAQEAINLAKQGWKQKNTFLGQ